MVKNIIRDFRSSVTISADEVALFRGLANAITKHSISTFIDETHGRVCNVSFTSVTGKPEVCEIADLLIVSTSAKDSALRATFLQIKKETASKWIRAGASWRQLDFGGQFNQWDLLSRRPAVTAVGGCTPPSDLLSSFQSPSIGSFGVFYDKSESIELVYSVAEFVACANPATTHPRLSINGDLSKYYFQSTEAISKADLESFMEALFLFQIGARLVPSIAAHQWLIRSVRAKARKASAPVGVIEKLDRFMGDGGDAPEENVPSLDGVSILIVGQRYTLAERGI